MTINLPGFLQENFDLGRHSTKADKFTDGVLASPFYVNPKGYLKPNPDYKDPTPYDFGFFKSMTGMSTGDLCKYLHVDNRNMNSLVGQTGWEKGKRIPSYMWCQLIEAAGLSERLIIRPKFADIREEVLETSQILPTKHELYLIFGLSGRSIEDISRDSGIALEALLHNCHRGDVVIDYKLEYVPQTDDSNQTKVHSSVVSLTVEQWLKLRSTLAIKDSSFILTPPPLRACTLSVNAPFSAYKKFRSKSQVLWDNLANLVALVLPQKDIDAKAKIQRKKGAAYYEAKVATEYRPPSPMELRSLIFWTGYSIGELSMLLGMKPKDLAFLISHKAINHRAIKKGQPGEPKTQHIQYAQWRRFAEVFNLTTPGKINLIRSIE